MHWTKSTLKYMMMNLLILFFSISKTPDKLMLTKLNELLVDPFEMFDDIYDFNEDE